MWSELMLTLHRAILYDVRKVSAVYQAVIDLVEGVSI
jgi:hypothetical protein